MLIYIFDEGFSSVGLAKCTVLRVFKNQAHHSGSLLCFENMVPLIASIRRIPSVGAVNRWRGAVLINRFFFCGAIASPTIPPLTGGFGSGRVSRERRSGVSGVQRTFWDDVPPHPPYMDPPL